MDPQQSTSLNESVQALANNKVPWYMNQWVGYVSFGIFVVLLINLLILDYVNFLQPNNSVAPQLTPTQNILTQPPVSTNPTYCPTGCMDLILQSTSSANIVTNSTAVNSSVVSTPTPTSIPTPTPTPINSPNEYFVPLGTGSGNYTTWTSIPGLGASINTLYYQNISTVVFEATVWIPTGNQTVYVQLYNANTFQSIVNSQMTVIGSVPTLVTTPISLTSGNNLYQVQLTTQLGYTTYIQQARLRIQTN